MAESVFALKAVLLSAHGLGAAESGVIFSIMSIIGAFAPLIGGVLADRYLSRYQVFFTALIGFSLICALLPISAKIRIGSMLVVMIVLPMIQFFHPVGSALIATCSINAVNRVGGTEYSFIRLWMSLGYTIASILQTFIIEAIGIDAPFYLMSLCLLFALIYKDAVKECERTEAGTVAKGEKIKVSFRPLFRNYFIVSFVLLNMIYVAASNCSSYTSYILEYYRIDVSNVGLVAGLKVVGEILIMLILPWLKKEISLSGLQLLSGIFQCAELLFMREARILPLIIFAEILGGIGNGIAFSCAGLYVRQMAPKGLEATAQSIWAMSSSLGGIFFSALFGYIIDRADILVNYKIAFWIQAFWAILFLGSLCFGKYVLKKENAVPMVFNRSRQKNRI